MKIPLLCALAASVLSPLLLGQPSKTPICGNPVVDDDTFLRQERFRTVQKNVFAAHPEFVLGAIDTFWVYNFTTELFDQVPAELRASGALSHVWVALDELQNGHVDSGVVSDALDALETATPASSKDSSQGILELMRDHFGDPPNVNSSFAKGAGDGKTHFLLCDIKDDWSPTLGGSFIAGFFFRVDVDPSTGLVAYSNRRDMLYIDTYPGIYHDNARGVEQVLGTLAHEFQHLIHWNYDPGEATFFNEGLSEYSSYVCGYGLRSPSDYFEEPNVAFLGWSSEIADYSRAALWTLYLAEQFGDMFMRNFVRNAQPGQSGFQSAIFESGMDASFNSAVRSFHIANILQNRMLDSAFGYIDMAVVGSKPRTFASSFSSQADGSRAGLNPLAADYVRLFAPETLRTTVSATAGSVSATVLELRDQALIVRTIPIGSPYESEFSSASKSEAIMVVQNTNGSASAGYTYSHAGTAKTNVSIELANDDGSTHSQPNMNLVNGDTVFVIFDGVDGGVIDSVALWFASSGTARLFVRDWNRNYDFNNQPLGGIGGSPRMPGSPLAFNVSDTGFMKTVINLRSLNIRSGPAFVIQVIYGANGPHPLLRRDESQAVVRSYLSLRNQPVAGRNVYESFGDFYVRAYASATNEPLPPFVVVPETFALHQNYPNPFNPTTIIAYDLPARARAKLAVYDMLGREIVVLRNEEQDANRYTVEFDGSRLAAGVYFLRLTAGEFAATRKMIIVR